MPRSTRQRTGDGSGKVYRPRVSRGVLAGAPSVTRLDIVSSSVLTIDMKRVDATRGLQVLLAGVVALSGCGGPTPEPASPSCEGVVLLGACWVADEGITLTLERVARVVARADTWWDHQASSLNGWRIEFRRERVAVNGTPVDGHCSYGDRLIVATPFAPDCFEDSAIFHELGHAWGFGEDDPRMGGMWPLIRAAMEDSGWEGCSVGEDDDQAGPARDEGSVAMGQQGARSHGPVQAGRGQEARERRGAPPAPVPRRLSDRPGGYL